MLNPRVKQAYINACLMLVFGLIIVLTFAPTLRQSFLNWDDDTNFLKNSHFRGLDQKAIEWAFSATLLGVYQPISWIIAGLQYSISGLDPSIYHSTNIILHLINSYLVLALILELGDLSSKGQNGIKFGMEHTGRGSDNIFRISATYAALWYAINPLRTETVAWISAQPYLITSTLLLSSIFCHLKVCTSREKTWRLWYCLSLIFGLLAILAKATAIVLPALLILIDYLLGRFSLRTLLWEKLPYFFLSMLCALAALHAHNNDGFFFSALREQTISDLIFHAVYALYFYPIKTIWSSNLSALYMPPLKTPFLWVLVAGGGLSICSTIVWTWYRKRPLCLGILGYIFALTPLQGFVRHRYSIVADRYSYIPMICLAIVLAFTLSALMDRIPERHGVRAGLGTAALLSLFLYCHITNSYAMTWRDSESLWHHVVDITPDDPSGDTNNNYGMALEAIDKHEEAEQQYRLALDKQHNHAYAYYNLGNILRRKGQMTEAIEALLRAIEIAPSLSEAYTSLSIAFFSSGDTAQGFATLRKALQIDPQNPLIHYNLSVAFATMGHPSEARESAVAALKLDPTNNKLRDWAEKFQVNSTKR